MFEAHQSYIKDYKKVNELLKLTSAGLEGAGCIYFTCISRSMHVILFIQ